MEGHDMSATAVLKEEHGGVKIMLGILGKVCDRLQAGGYPDFDHIDGILEFLRVFVDTCHHGKEEDFLFPAIEKTGGRKDQWPIEELRSDHGRGREFIRKMTEAVPGIRKGDGPAVNRFIRNAREYICLLRAHIDREDSEVFPLCDARLPKEQQETLIAEFERVEEERIGHGKHEEFHHFMDQLKVVYGV
jgi:hemerythrin-like domain-containing protein